MLKKWIRSAINPFGIDFVKYPLSPLGHQLRNFLREQRINLVVDVGACDGGFCRLLRSEAEYFGPIVSFEPCLKTFQAAQRKMSNDKNWRGLQIGLSDDDTEGILNTFDDNADWNSLHALRKEGASAYNVDMKKRRSEKIELRKFDTLWDKITHGIKTPRIFMKMDTQGHDTKVFIGAMKSLKFILGVQSELPAIEMYDGMTSMSDTLKFFNSLNYTPIGFYEVSGPAVFGGAVPEFDVVFKRMGDDL